MTYIKTTFFIICISILFTSCLFTFYPIYTEKDVSYDPSLIGKYKRINNSNDVIGFMSIEPLTTLGDKVPKGIHSIKNKGYYISTQNEDGSSGGTYIAFRVALNNSYYFDFFPLDGKFGRDDFYSAFMLPMHSIYKLKTFEKNQLVLHQFGEDFLETLINKRQIRIKHEKIADHKLITAPTVELQQYIVKYGNRNDAFEKDTENYIKY